MKTKYNYGQTNSYDLKEYFTVIYWNEMKSLGKINEKYNMPVMLYNDGIYRHVLFEYSQGRLTVQR